jgi:chemotaxis protein CheX
MPVTSADVGQFISEIWQIMLNCDVEPVNKSQFENRLSLMSCVQITGAWSGSASLEMSKNQARRVAARMMSLDEFDESLPDLAHDALGELANMFGGNVKAILPPPCYLSLPVVGTSESFSIPGVERQNFIDMYFATEGEVFRASLWHAVLAGPSPSPASIAPVLMKPTRSPDKKGSSLIGLAELMLTKSD